jgi:hypothetical protein
MSAEDVHWLERGTEFRPAQQRAKELFPNGFPQPNTRLSGSNIAGSSEIDLNPSQQLFWLQA